MPDSSQKFIGRNRPPRVQIEYDVELYGSEKKVQIPFVMGVLADLSGKAKPDDPVIPVDDRKFLEIDVDNFNERLKAMKPHVAFDVPNVLTGEGNLKIDLTFESMDLIKQSDVFAGLDGKVIIFSCCEVGADRRVMKAIKKISGAAAVIGYRLEVDDWYTNLVETMLYERLINTRMSAKKVVKRVNEALSQSMPHPSVLARNGIAIRRLACCSSTEAPRQLIRSRKNCPSPYNAVRSPMRKPRATV